jgi:predicted secreted protein
MKLSTTQLIWIYRLSLAGMITTVLFIVLFALGSSIADSSPGDILPKIIIGTLMLSPIIFLLSLAAFFSSRQLSTDADSSDNSGQRFTKALLWITAIPTCLLIVWLLIMMQWGYDLGSVR